MFQAADCFLYLSLPWLDMNHMEPHHELLDRWHQGRGMPFVASWATWAWNPASTAGWFGMIWMSIPFSNSIWMVIQIIAHTLSWYTMITIKKDYGIRGCKHSCHSHEPPTNWQPQVSTSPCRKSWLCKKACRSRTVASYSWICCKCHGNFDGIGRWQNLGTPDFQTNTCVFCCLQDWLPKLISQMSYLLRWSMFGWKPKQPARAVWLFTQSIKQYQTVNSSNAPQRCCFLWQNSAILKSAKKNTFRQSNSTALRLDAIKLQRLGSTSFGWEVPSTGGEKGGMLWSAGEIAKGETCIISSPYMKIHKLNSQQFTYSKKCSKPSIIFSLEYSRASGGPCCSVGLGLHYRGLTGILGVDALLS